LEYFRQLFTTKQGLILENLILRQQLNIYKRKSKRPKLENIDRIILVWISRIFSDWKSALVVVKPATVIGWHKKVEALLEMEISKIWQANGRLATH
jgi:hypothetical protein